jgi:hypothetical protein
METRRRDSSTVEPKMEYVANHVCACHVCRFGVKLKCVLRNKNAKDDTDDAPIVI